MWGMENSTFKAVCQFFGSQRKTAAALGVTAGMVNHVAMGRRPIPARWCPQIEQASKRQFLCEELRPDIQWSVLRPSFTGDEAR